MRFSALLHLLPLIAVPALHAQSTLEAAPSGRGRAEVTLNPRRGADSSIQAATIVLDYGQPHLRGRRLHTDSLVPYDVAWRTGANATTTLTTGVDLTIGGVAVPRGSYAVFTMPTRTGWTMMLQRLEGAGNMQQAMMYDPAKDAARIPLRRRELREAVESLTMWLIPSRDAGAPKGELRILWGNVELAADWVVR